MSAGIPSSPPAEPTRRSWRRRVRLPVIPGGAGDHPSIYYFLLEVFQGPTRSEFKASLEDPFYEPHDRLLLKRGHQLAAHVHVTHRVMQLRSASIPVAGLGYLATLPEFRRQGLGTHLLKAAEKYLSKSGALLGLIETSIPQFFRHTGWAICGRHSYSQADARAVLARLLDAGLRKGRRRLTIRPWRQWELEALKRIYNQNLPRTFGHLQRTEAYWHWLLRRRAYDQLYVALNGPESPQLGETSRQIVGYAATSRGQIAELLTAPSWRKASAELLARCCHDAIELGRHSITLHASPTSPLHKILHGAGGRRVYREEDRGRVFMVRVLEPLKLLRCLGGMLAERAERAGLPRPLELGLLVGRQKYQLEIDRGGTRVAARRIGRSYLDLDSADFPRLLLGQLNWDQALAERRLRCSSGLARDAGRVLFPRLPLWHPPLDDLPA